MHDDHLQTADPHAGDLWLAPVRNLTWVAARYGHR